MERCVCECAGNNTLRDDSVSGMKPDDCSAKSTCCHLFERQMDCPPVHLSLGINKPVSLLGGHTHAHDILYIYRESERERGRSSYRMMNYKTAASTYPVPLSAAGIWLPLSHSISVVQHWCWGIMAGLQLALPFMPKVLDEVGVMALWRPVKLFHSKLGKPFL